LDASAAFVLWPLMRVVTIFLDPSSVKNQAAMKP